ncbi:MAG: hypothetical protein J3Q66DRAFT_139406 [Benniella sp.]|nr:MAG: hypothetical protein J3Q66DRAFT_139406 [Benniella sp.]
MSFSPTKSPPSSPTTKAALRSRSPPLSLPVLSTTLPGFTPFDRAVHVVNVSNNSSQSLVSSTGEGLSEPVTFTPVEELRLYGAYKQGTKGNVNTTKPPFYEITAGSRWQAWANMKGKTQAEAQEIYVDIVVQNLTKYGSPPDHHALADEILQRPPTPPPAVAFPTANAPSLHGLPDLDRNSLSININTASHPQDRVRESSTHHSTAPPAYEISAKSFPDGETGGQSLGATAVHHGGRVTDSGFLENASAVPVEGNTHVNANIDDEEDSDEEAYQSSLEYDEDDKEERPPVQPVTRAVPQDSVQRRRRNRSDGAGVFDEDEKDEREAKGFVQASQPMAHIVQNQKDSKEDGSAHLGYRVSLPLDKVVQPYNTLPILHGQQQQQDKNMKHADLVLPPVYSVNAVYDTVISPPTLEQQQPSNDDENAAARGAFSAASSVPLPSPPASEASFPTVAPSHPGSMEEQVCPVSKKTASSGGVCPAAMFAQARANPHAGVSTHANTDAGSARIESAHHATTPESARADAQTSASHQPLLRGGSTAVPMDQGQHPHHQHPHRAMTAPEPMPPTPPVSASAVSAATNQGMRIGQGIVNGFSALRSSLAAASARATSLATGNSNASSTSTSSIKDPRAMVVKDPITNQSVTVMCPHMNNTQVMETEIVRLQTDISVLHERLDALQETLQLKSESRAQARRSPRGILKMVLRQGLINAILLLIVFAILYKRKSPIAYAILAYVGQSRKESEAGWRALMRWGADMIKSSQRNQQNLLRAGRRNGYW